MFRFRKRAPSHSDEELPPSKRVKNASDSEQRGRKRLASSIRRKTKSSAKLARPGSIFGIFSKSANHLDANEHAKQISDKIAAGCEDSNGTSRERSMFAKFSGLSLKRTSAKQESHMMSGGRAKPGQELSDNADDGSLSLQLRNKQQSFLRSARSRLSLKIREQPPEVPLIKVFSPQTFDTIRYEPQTIMFSFEDLDPSSHVESQTDSGYGSSYGEAKRSEGMSTIEELPHHETQTLVIPHSAPIDVPQVNQRVTQEPQELRRYSPESVGRIVEEELGHSLADEGEESLLSISPHQSVKATAAIRPSSVRQMHVDPGSLSNDKDAHKAINTSYIGFKTRDKDIPNERYPSLLAKGGTPSSVRDFLNRPHQLRATPERRTDSPTEMHEDDYARCVSRTTSISEIVDDYLGNSETASRREIDIRSRRREDMAMQRRLAMDDVHGHIRSSTATAAEEQRPRHVRQLSAERFSELDGETLKAMVNRSDATARRMNVSEEY